MSRPLRASRRRDTPARCRRAPGARRAQPLGEFAKRIERRRLRRAVDALVGGEPAAQAHHLAHGVERIDLALDDAADLEVKAVRAEIDRRESFMTRHAPTVASGNSIVT